MVMHEQSRRLAEPLRWGRREKTLVAILLSVLVLAIAGLVAYALSSGAPARTGADCVTVTFASTLGGADLHGCGEHARAICASGSFPHIEEELRSACAKAGFAYRRAR
jgi:hypothetical protein